MRVRGFLCSLPVDKKIFWGIVILFAVITASLSICSCTDYRDILSTSGSERQPVNEKCFCVFNKGHLPVGEFLIEAGKHIDAKIKYNGWKTYRVRVLGKETLFRVWEIHTIVVYYNEQ